MRSVHCGMCGGRICAYMLLRTYVVGYDDVGGDSYELLATLTHPLSSVHVSLSCLLETICWFTEAWSVISDPRLPPTAGQTPHNLRLQLPSSLRFSDASVGSRHPDVVKRVRSPRYDRTARKMRKNIWMYTYCALMSRRWFHFGVFVSFIESEVLVLMRSDNKMFLRGLSVPSMFLLKTVAPIRVLEFNVSLSISIS